MMKDTKSETKQSSLIHQRIRNAGFVSLENQDTERFKYKIELNVSKYFNGKLNSLKAYYNKRIQGLQLQLNKIDSKSIKTDLSLWFAEVCVEGFVMNFIVWALMDWKFTVATMLAWGFLVKQFLSIYWRIKKDGTPSKLFAEHQ